MSACTCQPWRGYHGPTCPCQAAYAAHRPAEPTADEVAEAQALVAAGYVQVSRKYRRIFQLPAPGTALGVLDRVDPGKAAALRASAAQRLEAEARSVVWALQLGDSRELDPSAFEAFRRAVTDPEVAPPWPDPRPRPTSATS